MFPYVLHLFLTSGLVGTGDDKIPPFIDTGQAFHFLYSARFPES